MQMILRRLGYYSDGIFSELTIADSLLPFCSTLEHSYRTNDGTFAPKLPKGTYKCARGQHNLHSGPIETFEITGVPGHSGILFHVGNVNNDSEGCVLMGSAVGELPTGQRNIVNSRVTFTQFMGFLAGIDEFDLNVV